MDFDEFKKTVNEAAEQCVITPAEALELGKVIGLISTMPEIWSDMNKNAICEVLNLIEPRMLDPRFLYLKSMYDSWIKMEEK